MVNQLPIPIEGTASSKVRPHIFGIACSVAAGMAARAGMARFSLALFSAVVVCCCGTALAIERAAVKRASTTRTLEAAALGEPSGQAPAKPVARKAPPRAVPRPSTPFATVGGVALFLASEDARYLTGNTLFVDGGGHINGVGWVPDLGPDS